MIRDNITAKYTIYTRRIRVRVLTSLTQESARSSCVAHHVCSWTYHKAAKGEIDIPAHETNGERCNAVKSRTSLATDTKRFQKGRTYIRTYYVDRYYTCEILPLPSQKPVSNKRAY